MLCDTYEIKLPESDIQKLNSLGIKYISELRSWRFDELKDIGLSLRGCRRIHMHHHPISQFLADEGWTELIPVFESVKICDLQCLRDICESTTKFDDFVMRIASRGFPKSMAADILRDLQAGLTTESHDSDRLVLSS